MHVQWCNWRSNGPEYKHYWSLLGHNYTWIIGALGWSATQRKCCFYVPNLWLKALLDMLWWNPYNLPQYIFLNIYAFLAWGEPLLVEIWYAVNIRVCFSHLCGAFYIAFGKISFFVIIGQETTKGCNLNLKLYVDLVSGPRLWLELDNFILQLNAALSNVYWFNLNTLAFFAARPEHDT